MSILVDLLRYLNSMLGNSGEERIIKKEKYIINGKEYSSWSDIPPDLRKRLDTNQNGVVDGLEGISSTVKKTRKVYH